MIFRYGHINLKIFKRFGGKKYLPGRGFYILGGLFYIYTGGFARIIFLAEEADGFVVVEPYRHCGRLSYKTAYRPLAFPVSPFCDGRHKQVD